MVDYAKRDAQTKANIAAANDILRADCRVEIRSQNRGWVIAHMDAYVLEQPKGLLELSGRKKVYELTVDELVKCGKEYGSKKTGKDPMTPNIHLANISLKEHGVEIRKTGLTFVYAHLDPEHEKRHAAKNLRCYVGEFASINGIRPVELIAHGVEFADELPDEEPAVQAGSTADLKYKIETTEVSAGWNDSGFRHRVVCSDGRHSRWAPYTVISYLDDFASVPPYFHGGNDNVSMSIAEAFALLAYGEEKHLPKGDDGDEDPLVVATGSFNEEDDGCADEAVRPEGSQNAIWFPGKSLKMAKTPFELCWYLRSDDSGLVFGDRFENELTTVSAYAEANEHGSLVLELHEFVLVLDDANNFWGMGTSLDAAIAAMPNNMEALPFTCAVYTNKSPMTVTENGCVKGAGAHVPVQVMRKNGKTIKPVMPK